MKLKFKNLGGIKEGNVSIYPLTIFYGSPVEKDYLLAIIHSIFADINNIPEKDINYIVEQSIKGLWKLKTSKEIFNKLENITEDELNQLIIEIEKNLISYIKGRLINIKQIFNSPKNPYISEFSIENIQIEGNKKINYKKIKENIRRAIEEYEAKKILLLNIFSNPYKELFRNITSNKFPVSHFYPASRSGLILSADFVIPSVLNKFAKTKVKLTRPVIDFLTNLASFKLGKININEKQDNNTRKVFKFFRERVLNGDFKEIVEVNQFRKYEFIPLEKEFSIDLHSIPNSKISMLPIYLLLRSLKTLSGNVLIFEEAETHLSKEELKEFARFLALLIHFECYVVLSTKSEALLYEINNLIKLRGLNIKDARDYLIKNDLDDYPEVSIKKNKVKLYYFKQLDHRVKLEEIGIDEFGIPESLIEKDFLKLQKEAVELSEKLLKGSGQNG